MSSAPRKWKFRLRHMQEAAAKVLRYTAALDAVTFAADERTVEAVVWNLTVLGEAARHIPDDVERAYAAVPWPQMKGIRNRIVHGYDQIDLDVIWNVVRVELPPLLPLLDQVMREAPE
jgi:uncharacterized protein with HEPN domain